MQEINLGYDNGADRLLLRFPQVVTHAVTPESPLAKWTQARGTPAHAAELVIVVEGVLFSKSATVSRTVTLKLPQDLHRDKCFAPMVHSAGTDTAVPSIDWHAFHTVIAPGEKWSPGVAADLGAGLGPRAPSNGLQLGAETAAPQDVDLTGASPL